MLLGIKTIIKEVPQKLNIGNRESGLFSLIIFVEICVFILFLEGI